MHNGQQMNSGSHNTKSHIVVVGAGAFGGWTALNLLRSGARVTLLDARGAGNDLASSGGDTRVIRHAYEQPIYVDLAARALQLWKQYDHEWGTQLFRPKGVLFFGRDRTFIDSAKPLMDAAGVNTELLNASELSRRFPQINTDSLNWAVYEPGAGYLTANIASIAVRDAFVAEGGDYRVAEVKPGKIHQGEMADIQLVGDKELRADQYVFACGPWLGTLFPEVLESLITVTRQEVYYFKPPAAKMTSFCNDLPVWAEVDERFYYGIPGHRGLFKIADDTRGPKTDPDTQSREPAAGAIESVRDYLKFRFPDLKDADMVKAHICQYTESKDYNFIVDRHPDAENVWLVGGGSGHAFKHGPALGELIAGQVLGTDQPVQAFALSRFDAKPEN